MNVLARVIRKTYGNIIIKNWKNKSNLYPLANLKIDNKLNALLFSPIAINGNAKDKEEIKKIAKKNANTKSTIERTG